MKNVKIRIHTALKLDINFSFFPRHQTWVAQMTLILSCVQNFVQFS